MFRCERRIANALSMPIWNLCNQDSATFGTGYDLKDLGEGRIKLELMDDRSDVGKVIKTFEATSIAIDDNQFIDEIVSSFEKNIMEDC